MKKLQEHGEYVAGCSRQTIMFAARGPWNDETLVRGSQEMGQNINQLNMSKPWGFISCLFGESLMTPSAYKLFLKHTVIRKSKGMRCLAVIIEDSDIANTIMSQLTLAYQYAGVDFAFLTDIGSAITWIEHHEIELDEQQVTDFFRDNRFVQLPLVDL
ncbi:MAG: hypothetical protein ACJAWT_001265 [Glaciecola sp.]|jgi:hypothetical protein